MSNTTDPSPTTLTDDEQSAINALDKDVCKGVSAMLKKADDTLEDRLQREVINPLLRRLRNTRIMLWVMTAALVAMVIAMILVHPTKNAVHADFSERDNKIADLETWRTQAKVTSPITIAWDGGGSTTISFNTLTELFTTLVHNLSEVGEETERISYIQAKLIIALNSDGNEEDWTTDVSSQDAQGCYLRSYKLDDDPPPPRHQRHDGTNWQNCY